MRFISALIVLGLIVLIAVPVIRYRTIDPCRMLSADMAHEAYGPLAELAGNDADDVPEAIERSMRLVTSQMTTRECADSLWQRWTS
tara:strand:- start:3576 stop:3833 length:258 start_codon:yes stop_codon:yes gene_type:complete